MTVEDHEIAAGLLLLVVPFLAPRSPRASTEKQPLSAAAEAISTAREGYEVVISTRTPPDHFGENDAASALNEAIDRRERLRRLALETIDLAKDPYFMRNNLGSYECKLCLTLHNNEGNYLAHTPGKRHRTNLSKSSSRTKEAPAQPQPHKRKVFVRKTGMDIKGVAAEIQKDKSTPLVRKMEETLRPPSQGYALTLSLKRCPRSVLKTCRTRRAF